MSNRIGSMRFVAFAAAIGLTLSANAHVLIDDFDDGNDDGWTRYSVGVEGMPWGPPIFDAGTGSYHLATTGAVPEGVPAVLLSTWNESVDPFYSEGFLQATVRADNDLTSVITVMRGTGDPGTGELYAYLFIGNPDVHRFKLSRYDGFEEVVLGTIELPFYPGENWIIQGGAVGDQISMKVWRAGDPEPDDPQLVVTDSTYTYGQFAVEASHRTSGEASISGVFDDIYFIPPPGEIYVVNPEGTGDFPTIQAAIDAVHHGDVIELTDGTFTGDGNRDMDYLGKAITIRSQSGNPQACIIDCAGSPGDPHRGFSFVSDEGPESLLEGMTITNGYLPPPGWGAGVEGSGSSPTFINCIFSDNSAYEGGGANFTSASHPTFIGCLFSDNSATAGGGVAIASGSSATLTDCTFSGNSGLAIGGGLSFVWSLGTVVSCTFYGNGSPQGSGIHSGYGSALDVQNCIVAFSTQGPGVGCGSFVIPTLTCCDIYGNAGGDWVGDIADQLGVNGNICEDPLFCDPEDGDFAIPSDSPCAPDYNPECGLIGAWPAECCVGDLDGDRDTDQSDLGVLLADWGCDDPVNGCAGDLNGDDKTDQADLGILLGDWGCGT